MCMHRLFCVNCGGKKRLNHFTFVSELLGTVFFLHLLLTPGSVAPWPFLLGCLFLLNQELLHFSSLLTWGFSIVSVLLLNRTVTSGLLKVCMAMGWCLHWGLQGLCGALSDMQI